MCVGRHGGEVLCGAGGQLWGELRGGAMYKWAVFCTFRHLGSST